MNRNKSVPHKKTRTVFERVRKYDRRQFDMFCDELYKNGYEDRRDSVPGIDVEKVLQAISEVKGIGTKKLEEVKQKLEDLFKEEEKC